MYQGTFRRGERHGYGTCTFPGGERYTGNWEKGKMHGEGTLDIKERTLTGMWDKGCVPRSTATHVKHVVGVNKASSFFSRNHSGLQLGIPSFECHKIFSAGPRRTITNIAECLTSTPRPMDTSVSCFLTGRACMTATGEAASVTVRARLLSPTVMCTTVSAAVTLLSQHARYSDCLLDTR